MGIRIVGIYHWYNGDIIDDGDIPLMMGIYFIWSRYVWTENGHVNLPIFLHCPLKDRGSNDHRWPRRVHHGFIGSMRKRSLCIHIYIYTHIWFIYVYVFVYVYVYVYVFVYVYVYVLLLVKIEYQFYTLHILLWFFIHIYLYIFLYLSPRPRITFTGAISACDRSSQWISALRQVLSGGLAKGSQKGDMFYVCCRVV